MARKTVAYYRVSTERQGISGLGLEAQQEAVKKYLNSNDGELVGAYIEVETGKKDALDNRPELRRALAHAKRSRAQLVVAKLDRLTRSVAVTSMLHQSNVDFICCDNPTANRMTIQILAAVAEEEVRQISRRTKDALAAKKARGGLLGAARPGAHQITKEAGLKGSPIGAKVMRKLTDEAYADLLPMMRAMQAEGLSLRQMAERLDAEGHSTRRGNAWNAVQVARVLARLDRAA